MPRELSRDREVASKRSLNYQERLEFSEVRGTLGLLGGLGEQSS
ncbi:hypothetical protein [Dongshaea marina]|nr:hypothetical protein [Dongshaea marina]